MATTLGGDYQRFAGIVLGSHSEWGSGAELDCLGKVDWSNVPLNSEPKGNPKQAARRVSENDSAGGPAFLSLGLLADLTNGCFTEVAKWGSTRKTFPPGQIVHADVAQFLQRAECAPVFISVNLKRVLEAEIGPQLKADQLVGERIGNLLSECKSVFELNTRKAAEVHDLLAFMKQSKLLADDGNCYPVAELVCCRSVSCG